MSRSRMTLVTVAAALAVTAAAPSAGQDEPPVLVGVTVATFGGPYNCDSPPPQGGGRSLPRCVYKPIRASAILAALDGSGRRVAIRTRADGRGAESVPAGRYELRAGPAPRRLTLRSPGVPRILDLRSGEPADVILDYDTGIS